MKEIHNNLIFHLYDPHQDGKGINLIVYRFDDNAKNYYTKSVINNYKPDDSDLLKNLTTNNIETFDELFEVKSKYITMLDENPESPKLKKLIEATSDIIRHFQEWFYDNDIKLPKRLNPKSYLDVFKYLDDYSMVWMRGEKFRLTKNQSEVVKILHEAHRSNTPELNFETIINNINSKADKMSDVFKTNKEAMHALIELNKTRIQYSLNIPI